MTKTISKKLKVGIVALIVISIVLVALIIVFNILNKTKKVEIDGDTYTIKEEKYCYRIFFEDNELEKTSDGYYLLHSGNLLDFDVESGEYSMYAYVDKEGTEAMYSNGRVLIFPYVGRNYIQNVVVENENGKFEINYNGTSFVIVGKESTILTSTALSELLTVAGYPLGIKLNKAESLDIYGYEEYGLDNPKAKYSLTTIYGDIYSVEIGDKTPDGYGYYAKYSGDDRQAVYILSATDYIDSSLMSGVESIVAPILSPNLGYNMYLNVQNLRVSKYSYDEGGNKTSKRILYASYLSKINGVDRLKTEYKSQSFFGIDDFSMYTPSADSINEMLYNLYTLEPLYVAALGTDNLAQYGLDKPKTNVYYETTYTVSGVEYHNKVNLFFTDKDENGIVYAYSQVLYLEGSKGTYSIDPSYNQIVALDANTIDFINFTKANFVTSNYFSLFFDYLSKISVKFDNKEYLIEVSHNDDAYEIVAIDDKNKRYILSRDEVQYEDKYLKVQTAESTNALFNNLYSMLMTSSIIGEHGLSDYEVSELQTDDNKLLEITFTTTGGRIMSYKYYSMSEVRSLITVGAEKTPGSKKYVEATDFFCYSSRIEKIKKDFENFYLALSYYAVGNFEAYDSIEISGR